MKIHHLNCLKIVTPVNDDVIGHCLLLEDPAGLALVDAGMGMLDAQQPQTRVGQTLIDLVGFRLDEDLAAYKQIGLLGFDPLLVKQAVISHLDPDHIGGLADFSGMTIHVGAEELANFNSGNQRYLPHQLSHNPEIIAYKAGDEKWMGLEAREVKLGFSSRVYLVPLFGHTRGHCGVAIEQGDRWVLYVGDAYYLRGELEDPEHPVTALATARADDNDQRLASLDKIRKLIKEHPEVEVFGYHDRSELKLS
ncbi:MAG: MBL fold hydrolase [Sphingobacteriales bacterium SCN 48-20]|uniref:MBL fold metallo-hydrolase n=1 Tax=Terrimonas ferruginea TaxID=249 RepID=UPI00086BD565|nr:MBL fold metallo-hydrolase [Terrimonas ferruginea]MBN8783532.1 MBL fold metallo-hydrolase [Terrimonas ferruginea]ODT92591.1 MAG: MBL fold hydrolase [Sphingobacteriales bacterium SCN 48-20]OJW40287.1 MAG: MBL fold hydrolase [Sphingobacteriales bacterium 48-107]